MAIDTAPLMLGLRGDRAREVDSVGSNAEFERGNTGPGLAYCNNWTDGTLLVSGGNANGGPLGWSVGNTAGCTPSPFICTGVTKNSAVGVTGTAHGRRIWVSTTAFTPNATTTPDSVCQGDRPAGVTTAMAFISTSKRAAGALITPSMSYYRPDNVLVGTGAALLMNSGVGAPSQLPSGIFPAPVYCVQTAP